MIDIFSQFTVLFEEPFWIGLCERTYENRYEVCKITFGAEPKDAEIYEFMLTNYVKLHFSPSTEAILQQHKEQNPKRMRRTINKTLKNTISIGTKAQQALKLQYEQGKAERKKRRANCAKKKKNSYSH